MPFVEQPRRSRSVSVRVSADEQELLSVIAHERGVTIAQVIRAALASTLDGVTKQSPEATSAT